MTRRATLLATAVLLLLSALLVIDRADGQRQALVRQRLDREVMLVSRLVEARQRALLRTARRAGRDPELVKAVVERDLQRLRTALSADLREDGADAFWVIDPNGRVLLAGGSHEGAPPVYGSPLLGAALTGVAGYGILPGRINLSLEAAAPMLPDEGAPPVGAVRFARRLDARLMADIEEMTGVYLAAAPRAYVLGPAELRTIRRDGLSPDHLEQVAGRADAVTCAWVRGAPDEDRRIVFQQFEGLGGEPVGLLALSVRTDDLTGWPQASLLALCAIAILALLVTASAGTLERSIPPGAGGLRLLGGGLRPRRDHGAVVRVGREDAAVDYPTDALHQIAEGLSHHLNNTLAVVIGNGELLERHISDTRHAAALGDVMRSANRAAEVVRLLQKAAYRNRLSWSRPVDLGAAWRQALQRVQAARDDTRPVKIEGLDGLEVPGLAEDLVEVFAQLLDNAFEATGPDGLIQVAGRRVGDRIEVTVADDGEGMTAEVRERAGELFYSSRGPQKVGLGLAAVDGIVSRHRGRWWIESEPGAGCTIHLDLPAWSGPNPTSGPY